MFAVLSTFAAKFFKTKESSLLFRAEATTPMASPFTDLKAPAISLYASSQPGLDELAVLLDKRRYEPVGAADKLIGLVPADTDLSLVDRVAVPGRDPDEPAVFHDKVDTAPVATVGAGAWYIFEIHVLTSNTQGLFVLYIMLIKCYKIMMIISGSRLAPCPDPAHAWLSLLHRYKTSCGWPVSRSP